MQNDPLVAAHDPTQLESHFAFGENWRDFSDLVTEERIAESQRGLRKLFPGDALAGRRMLDIGCGSGLSMLSALRLGVKRVDGFDFDPASVETARAVLARYCPGDRWSVSQASILSLAPGTPADYDIVYSWGVLHHTGDMWRAIANACALVAPGGLLCLALYRRTPLCPAWVVEKRASSAAPSWMQRIMRGCFKLMFLAGLVLTFRNPYRYVADYQRARGMAWHHDVHDWLGGYPYESASPDEVVDSLTAAGFAIDRSFERPAVAFGLFGSHCDEFVARRI